MGAGILVGMTTRGRLSSSGARAQSSRSVKNILAFLTGFALCLSAALLITRVSSMQAAISRKKDGTQEGIFIVRRSGFASRLRNNATTKLLAEGIAVRQPLMTPGGQRASPTDTDATAIEEKNVLPTPEGGAVDDRQSQGETDDVEEVKEMGSQKEPLAQDDLEVLDLVELRRVVERLGHGGGKLIVATLANLSFKEMLQNWVAHVRKSGMGDLILVAAFDNATYTWCKREGVESILLQTSLGEEDFRGSIKFRDMGSPKAWFLLNVLKMGYDVLMSDTDTAWISDPRQYLFHNSEVNTADILVSSDSVSHTNDDASMRGDASEEAWYHRASPHAGEMFGSVYDSSLNTGIVMFRATKQSILFVNAWYQSLLTVGKSEGWELLYDDQDAFNQLMHYDFWPIKVVSDSGEGHPVSNRVVWAYNKNIRLVLLPPLLFCNGHVFFVQRTPQRLGVTPFVVHNTFQFYFTAGKKIRFMEANLWALYPPSYYEEGNFLSFDVALPASFHSTKFPAVTRHFVAMAFYFLSIRNALAIATCLNRIIILPKAICYCDRYWQNLEPECRFPGEDAVAPFLCPSDHIINPYNWIASDIEFRVQSFLENPQVPHSVRTSRLNVSVVAREEVDGCQTPPCIAQGSTNAELAGSLSMYNSTRVLHLSSAYDAFSRFITKEENEVFEAQTVFKGLFGPEDWCCLPNMHKDKEEAHKTFFPPVPLAGFDHWAKDRWPNLTFKWRDFAREFDSYLTLPEPLNTSNTIF